jgi:hypothetical protein
MSQSMPQITGSATQGPSRGWRRGRNRDRAVRVMMPPTSQDLKTPLSPVLTLT